MESTAELARLRWRCRRGMRELDLLVGNWLERCYCDASDTQRLAFAHLLEAPDPTLLKWLTGRVRPEDPDVCALIDDIRGSS